MMSMEDEQVFGRLIVVKKSGMDGGVCEMHSNELIIGR